MRKLEYLVEMYEDHQYVTRDMGLVHEYTCVNDELTHDDGVVHAGDYIEVAYRTFGLVLRVSGDRA